MRHEIGIDKFIFATDYPHPEGTWPDTAEWLRVAFDGVPAEELPKLLGGNAVTLLGIDRAPLDAAAARIGPRPSDILGHSSEVDADLVENFHKRSGFKTRGSRSTRPPSTAGSPA